MLFVLTLLLLLFLLAAFNSLSLTTISGELSFRTSAIAAEKENFSFRILQIIMKRLRY